MQTEARLNATPLLRIRHDRVPGRLRLNSAVLYRNPPLCAAVQTRIGDMPGVRRTTVNPLTGSVQVSYAAPASTDGLLGLVADLTGCAVPVRSPPPAKSSSAAAVPSCKAAAPARPPEPVPSGGEEPRWHQLPAPEVVSRLETSPIGGLAAGEATLRLSRFGPNTLREAESRSDFAIFLEQFSSLPVALLGVSAVVSVATGGMADAAVILGVVLINAIIGFKTEREAETTIKALYRSGPREAVVIRDGVRHRIPVAQVVPGDLLLLSPGDQVAADARLLSARRLTVDESALTGESVPSAKNADAVLAPETPLGDRCNLVFDGTLVTGGNGTAVVVGTGERSELGHIQALVNEAQAPDTPMERQLDQLGTQLGLLSAAVCGGVFLVGLARGYGLIQMLKASVSLAVAAVPEGLPAVATTTLALGIREMQRRKVAVRRLEAVETLGSVQVLCLDKTGTLTLNRMSLAALHLEMEAVVYEEGRLRGAAGTLDIERRPTLQRLLETVSLCSEVEIAADGTLSGSPTEQALVRAALELGLDVPALRRERPCLELRPRAEDRPLMSTLHRMGDSRRLLAAKGAPAAVLERCTHRLLDGRVEPLADSERESILLANERMAGDALRVLGIAYREGDGGLGGDADGLTWLGLAGLADPIRPGMPALMRQFHQAGIQTVMITGDQSATAFSIGRQLGLGNGRPLRILDSQALDRLDPELLAGLARQVQIFSRVSPAHKLRIVQALQRAGNVVAMTGDGMNDGPALKAADIGVAMGGGGTDVARQVADLVVEDDNLNTLADAVSQGRTIYANIRKTLRFLLSTNFSEIQVMLAGVALGVGEPLNPMQLLWINLISDIFPGLALSQETPDPRTMERPPRDPSEPVVSMGDLKGITRESLIISAGALAAYGFGISRYGAGAQASTLAFNTLTTGQLLHALVCRSDRRTLVTGDPLPRNRYLELALGGSLALQGITLVTPALRGLLRTTPVGLLDLLVIGAGAVAPLVVNEILKPPRSPQGSSVNQETSP